jgi:hypothetical protein
MMSSVAGYIEKVEKKGSKKKEMITVEVKNGSASLATARGYGDLV